VFLVITGLWIISIFGLFIFTDMIHVWIDHLVRAASMGEANIVSAIASDLHRVAPEVYIQRYFVFFLWGRSAYFIFPLLILFFLYHRYFSSGLLYIRSILFPAILLGFTTSIRILGPFAGLIVACYAIYIDRKRALLTLVVYATVAIAAMYITWPYLWSNPLGHFMESLKTMARFPWYGLVLFNGREYESTNLPYTYLPVLLAIQLTEPVWPLFMIGLAGVMIKDRGHRELFYLVAIWFMLPLVILIITRAALYDNFRQILFILPPVFLIGGLGLDLLFKYLNKLSVQIMMIVLLILPGLVAGARLHPYEYVYYNNLVGNPTGRFELDYWATSYREAIEYLNKVAPAAANIQVVGPHQLDRMSARADLIVRSYNAAKDEPVDYVIITSRGGFDRKIHPEANVIYAVERVGMTFSVVKEIKK
jgi:hypothetical protein